MDMQGDQFSTPSIIFRQSKSFLEPVTSSAHGDAWLKIVFLAQAKSGISCVRHSSWSPINRLAFASTYRLEQHPSLDRWLLGSLRNGQQFSSPLNPEDRFNSASLETALCEGTLVGPYDEAESTRMKAEQLPVEINFHRPDSDYVLDCNELLQAKGSVYSNWRWYLRIAGRAKLKRVELSNVLLIDLEKLLADWGAKHQITSTVTFDLNEMRNIFSIRQMSSKIDGFGYYEGQKLVGITICDLTVAGVVNLLFMKTTNAVPHISRLAIHDIAVCFGKNAIINLGQDLGLAGLRQFKSQLPNSYLLNKHYLRRL